MVEAVQEARGAYAFGADQFGLAAKVIQEELVRKGWRPRLAMNLAACQARQGDWEGARETYERGLMLSPKHLGLRIGLGVTFMEQGKLELAAPVLMRVQPLGIDGPRLLMTQAALLRKLGKESEAAQKEAE